MNGCAVKPLLMLNIMFRHVIADRMLFQRGFQHGSNLCQATCGFYCIYKKLTVYYSICRNWRHFCAYYHSEKLPQKPQIGIFEYIWVIRTWKRDAIQCGPSRTFTRSYNLLDPSILLYFLFGMLMKFLKLHIIFNQNSRRFEFSLFNLVTNYMVVIIEPYAYCSMVLLANGYHCFNSYVWNATYFYSTHVNWCSKGKGITH